MKLSPSQLALLVAAAQGKATEWGGSPRIAGNPEKPRITAATAHSLSVAARGVDALLRVVEGRFIPTHEGCKALEQMDHPSADAARERWRRDQHRGHQARVEYLATEVLAAKNVYLQAQRNHDAAIERYTQWRAKFDAGSCDHGLREGCGLCSELGEAAGREAPGDAD